MTTLHDLRTPDRPPVDTIAGQLDSDASTSLQTALLKLAAGGMIVLCDDTERPTRGELVFAASESTAALVAYAVRRGSRFLQVALPGPRCDQLGLGPQCGADFAGLQLCVTVDAKSSIGTGISASDRSITIRLLASPQADVYSFTRPGHVVPVRADMQRPVNDFGFAEAAIWLTTAAGVGAAAVLTTVIGVVDPIGIATGRDLQRFSEDHGLPLVSLRDLSDRAGAGCGCSVGKNVKLKRRAGAGAEPLPRCRPPRLDASAGRPPPGSGDESPLGRRMRRRR
jgi:3,4-dihydroxy-2-butanone 4-phosphate synthase